MRKTLLALLLLSVVAISPASARHWHWGWGWHHRHHADRSSDAQDFAAPESGIDRLAERGSRAGMSRSGTALDALSPANWTLQPPDPKWKGKRFVSADGSAWFAAYSTPVGQETFTDHMKSFAFVDGESIAFLQAEKDWIVVGGTKQDKVFYRKAVVACGGQSWHHVAFEYPLAAKGDMARYIKRAGQYVERTTNEGCEGNASAAAATEGNATPPAKP